MALQGAPLTTFYDSVNFTPTVKELTLAVWVKAPAPLAVASVYTNAIYCETGAANQIGAMYITWDHAGGSTFVVQFIGDGPSYPTASMGGVTANTWTHACAVFNGTQILAYKNGTLQNTTAVTLASTPPAYRPRIHQAMPTSGTGYMCDAGMWNATLNAAEIAAMAKGISAGSIRPARRFFFAPHIRNQVLLHSGTAAGGAGNTASEHPRLYLP